MIRYISAAAVANGLLLALSAPALADNTWSVDPAHTTAQFSVRHMMISNVKGDFTKVSGSADYDGKHLNKAKVSAVIDVTSVDTHEPHRDAHLKGKDFFDVEKYPTMTFESKKIETTGKGKFKMIGDLTLHGVTKEVTLEGEGPTEQIKDPHGNMRMGASAEGKINRKDFGLTYAGALDNGGAVIGDDVGIALEVELMKKATPVADAK